MGKKKKKLSDIFSHGESEAEGLESDAESLASDEASEILDEVTGEIKQVSKEAAAQLGHVQKEIVLADPKKYENHPKFSKFKKGK